MSSVSPKLLAAAAIAATMWMARSAHAQECGRLSPGQVLDRGQSITSCNGQYRLDMQEDGNLVQYGAGGRALWWTNTFDEFGWCWDHWSQSSICSDQISFYFVSRHWAVMQGDGNLVVYATFTEYDTENNPVVWYTRARWNSRSANNPGAWLAVQDDSNLVVYAPGGRPLWHRW